MNASLIDALIIVAIGLTAVFTTLIFVYFSGQFLIILVNKLSPEPAAMQNFAPQIPSRSPRITSKNMAIIAATVESVTQGRGKISNIQKVEK